MPVVRRVLILIGSRGNGTSVGHRMGHLEIDAGLWDSKTDFGLRFITGFRVIRLRPSWGILVRFGWCGMVWYS